MQIMATAIEQFEYIRNIGKGSYGEVTLARHKRDRKQVNISQQFFFQFEKGNVLLNMGWYIEGYGLIF